MNAKKILIGIGAVILIAALIWIFSEYSQNSNPQSSSRNNTTSNMSDPTEESPTFTDTTWAASSIENYKPIAGTAITIQFDSQGKVTGSDGCNSFSGTYTLDESKIEINSDMISTQKTCGEDIMQQADVFTKLLLTSTSYKLGDGQMALYQGTTAGLMFSGSTNSLSKTSWNVTGYNNGKEAVVSPIVDTNPTITFGDDGTISGNAGCNTFSGNYALSGNSITIDTLATTLKECIAPEGIMEQESSILAYIQKANTWSIQGNILYLRTAEDQLAIVATNSN